jgi:putative DNA primase/helicase
VGTTNAEEWLRDATGNRRFWPFDCTKADVAWIRQHRDQLWAEASHREAEGEPHWLDDADAMDEAKASQEDRMVEDPWLLPVSQFLQNLSRTTAPELLTSAVEMPKSQQNRAAQMRVSAILTRLGWKARRDKSGRWWERSW